MTSDLTAIQQAAVVELIARAPVLEAIGQIFADARHDLYLVGGSVRDALLGHLGHDLDLCTDALPETVLSLLSDWADSVWTIGQDFGTIGAKKHGFVLEITTYRAEKYDHIGRKPQVTYGKNVKDDLLRRDFTINAMAVKLPSRHFIDPYGGLEDLVAKRLRTPATATESFHDDPLRMLRAARFTSQLDFIPDDSVIVAMQELSDQITRISAERIRDELVKLLNCDEPVSGLRLLVDTGLAEYFLPELPGMKLSIDEHMQHKDVFEHSLTVLQQAIDHEKKRPEIESPDSTLRIAALLHDMGKPATRRAESDGRVSFHHHETVGAKMARKRLRQLRFPKEVIDNVSQLIFLHLRFHGYGEQDWTDSAVRRYAADAGELLPRLHCLVRSDCTTRNRRKAAMLAARYDDLEERLANIRAAEDLRRIRPDIDGNRIMEILGVPPGPIVGKAWKHLKELRLDHGPLSPDQAEAYLLEWANEQGLEPGQK